MQIATYVGKHLLVQLFCHLWHDLGAGACSHFTIATYSMGAWFNLWVSAQPAFCMASKVKTTEKHEKQKTNNNATIRNATTSLENHLPQCWRQ